jgi:CheY-like chemotaxis protein
MSLAPKILIIDDDADLVAVLRLVLERAGYRALDAPGADEGLVKAAAERPDLILLDVMMPSATEGFHFVWKLRQRPGAYFASVPVVIVSAIHDRTDLRFYPDSSDGSYKAGEYLPVQDFLDKPVDPADLLRTVEKVLGLAHKG